MLGSLKFQVLICSLLLLIQLVQCGLQPKVLITEQHKLRLKSLFNVNQKQLDSTSLPTIYYSLVGLNVLHNSNLNAAFESTQIKTQFCDPLKSFISQPENQNLDNLFHASSSLKLLNCQFDTAKLASLVEPMLTRQVTVPNLFKEASCLENAGKALPSAKIAMLLNEALKSDETFLSAGLSLQLASKLSRNDQTSFVNRIASLIAKADEVDGRYLQFEGGLGVTVSVIKGVLDLSTAVNKETGLTNAQVMKFTNYFLNRLTVQTTKGAAELLLILKQLTTNKYHIPVIVSLYGANVVNEKNSNIVVQVTNALGQTLNRQFSVTAKLNDLSQLLKFSSVPGDSTMFAVALDEQLKMLPAGKYKLKVTVLPVKGDKVLVIDTVPSEFNIVVQSSRVQLDSIEIGVGEKDQLSIKHEPVEYPLSLTKTLECDNAQKLSIKFCVRDLLQTKDLTVQQAFIYFVNEKTKDVVTFVADQDRISKVYNKDINLAYKGRDFNYQSGDYTIRLVVGDSILSQGISWTLGKVNIQFHNQDPIDEPSWLDRYKERPEIVHQFRQPEKRPPTVVSQTFTLLCLLPLLVLFICWASIDINFSNFSFSLSALLFHGSLLLIFVLYTLFFIRLNMFQTLKCLSGVLLTALFSGHYLLKRLASKSS